MHWQKFFLCLCLSWALTESAGGGENVILPAAYDVRSVLEAAGPIHGIVVILGAEPGTLPVQIMRQEGVFAHVIDPREDILRGLTYTLPAENSLLRRFLAESRSFAPLPHASGIVDIVLLPPWTEPLDIQELFAEVLRVLRPGGVFLGVVDPKSEPLWQEAAAHAGCANTLRLEHPLDGWIRVVKPLPPGMDAWSHWEHGPDNNPVSNDTGTHAPYQTQWLAQPYYIAMPAVTTAAGGRTFLAMGHIAHHEREEPWLNTLLARNGYNGMELWRRTLPDGYMVHRSAFIATPEVFYMIQPDGEGCLKLDPETGRETGRVRLDTVPGQWKWIAHEDGMLFALIGREQDPRETTVVRSLQPAWSWAELSNGYYQETVPWGFGETLVAYDLRHDRLVWRHDESSRIDSRGLAIGADRVFVYAPQARICAMQKETGALLWENRDPVLRQLIEEPGRGLSSTPGFRSTCFCIYTPHALVYAPQTNMNVTAVSPEDGALLWHRPKTTSNPNAVFLKDTLYIGIGKEGNTLALDPRTGETKQDLGFCKRSCARLTASPEALFCRGYPEGLTRYDRQSGRVFFDGSMRPACNDGVIAANGLIYIGPWLCDCNLTIMGTAAWCSAAGFEPEKILGERVVAPASGFAPGAFPLSGRDWYTHRGNNDHSGATKVPIARVLFPLWRWKACHSACCSAPVTAGDRIFLANDEGHVYGLDAETGAEQWRFAALAPIVQPPTVWKDRVLFGASDGYVYALDANTGYLLWKFRAAPIERRIMAYGALCSTWPVNSGVLVHHGVAYFAAGLIDYDGTYVYAVDAATGALVWANNTSGHLDKTLRKGVSAQGNLAVLGGCLWLAGGNVVSPAAYRLDNGAYAGPLPKDGSPESNRGEELGVFLDRGLVMGGRLRYSAMDNVVNPGQFILARCETPNAVAGSAFSAGQVAPAWDQELTIAMPGREEPPVAYASPELRTVLNGPSLAIPKRRWTASGCGERRVEALALTANTLVAACYTRVPRSLKPQYHLCLLERDTGKSFFELELPGPPRLNGLAIDRSGRVLVALAEGGLAAYGSLDTLRAMALKLGKDSRAGAMSAHDVEERLRHALESVHDTEGRQFLIARLQEQGIDLPAAARQSGAVTTWRLVGPVPWNASDDALDKAVLKAVEAGPLQTFCVEGRELSWRDYVTTNACGKVDLTGIYGPQENVVAYACAETPLSAEGDYQLKIGSNDGFICWFNNQEIGRFDHGRQYAPDQNVVPVHGRAGINRVLVKITQMGGGWAFGVRFATQDGVLMPLEK